MPALMSWDSYRGAACAERSGELFERGALDVRMVHGREHHRCGAGGNRFQTALQRTEHAALGIRIHGERHLRGALDAGSKLVGVVARHENNGPAYVNEQTGQAIQKGFTLKWEQSLRSSHAAGSAACKDNAGDRAARRHLMSARSDSLVKIDFERARQSDSGARRMAIISATMETAISSGVIAPISSPMGSKARSNASPRMPPFSNSFTTPLTLRLLHIMAMYLALVPAAQRITRMSSRWPRVTMTT